MTNPTTKPQIGQVVKPSMPQNIKSAGQVPQGTVRVLSVGQDFVTVEWTDSAGVYHTSVVKISDLF